jgi:26S proteasome regulatory subunit N9
LNNVDPAAAIVFLTEIAEKVKDEKDIYVMAIMEAAHYKLVTGDLDGTLKSIEESEKLLDALNSVDSSIHASFYRVYADYDKVMYYFCVLFKAKALYSSFYKNALLYLACANLDELSPQDKFQRAHDLGLAALLGDTIYNFGELVRFTKKTSL